MRRVAYAALTVMFVLIGISLLQVRTPQTATAVKAKKVECFGFHAAQTDDVAEVNVFNDSGQTAEIEFTFFRANGEVFSTNDDELAPHEVDDFEETFELGGSNGPIQRALVKVTSGPDTIAVDGSVHLNIGAANETMRSVTCQKG